MMIIEGIAAGSRVVIDMDKEGGLKFDVKSSKTTKAKKTVKDLVEEVE
jgi:Ni,Fe-hydrogenase III large subunit